MQNTEISLEIYQKTVSERVAQLESDLLMARALANQLAQEKQEVLDQLAEISLKLSKYEEMPEPDPIPSTKNKEVEIID